jgi:glycosyltransferase involved in cell wall biosynthesis
MESERFWDGIQLVSAPESWLRQAAVVVQPAFVENNPRRLLLALAAGIPVIATSECGIAEHPLLTLVPAGNAGMLRNALQKALSQQEPCLNLNSELCEQR